MTRRKCSRCRRTLSARNFRDITKTAASAAVTYKKCSRCRQASISRTDSDEEAWLSAIASSAISTSTVSAPSTPAPADSKQYSRCHNFRPKSLFTISSREYKTYSLCHINARQQCSRQTSPQYLPHSANSQDSPNVAAARAQIINIQQDHHIRQRADDENIPSTPTLSQLAPRPTPAVIPTAVFSPIRPPLQSDIPTSFITLQPDLPIDLDDPSRFKRNAISNDNIIFKEEFQTLLNK